MRAHWLVRSDGQRGQRGGGRLQHDVARVFGHVERSRRAARARQVPQVPLARRPQRRRRLAPTHLAAAGKWNLRVCRCSSDPQGAEVTVLINSQASIRP